MTRRTNFGTWQWCVLAMCAVAAIAYASARPSGVGATAPSAEAGAASHDATEDAVVLAKRSRGARPARPHAAYAAAAPGVASFAHPPKALPSQPAPLAPTSTPGAKATASRTPSPGAARATSVEMQEAANVLQRARGESSL